MKSTGIVRKMDQLGRIVIPKELRRTLGIEEKDPLEIFVENERIILQKYSSRGCAFCEKTEEVTRFKGKYICSDCSEEINSQNIS